ncbi:MAG: hypothetical protein JHC26_01435 [Thermofilum sp.]|jgi:hypothetical protein|uniref:hypothetical protein n=1 Tax=Thermofilum sp. TaxID=1961369 RepID=UPI0025871721|nr:hypothetical protein [Thermofilum sp.]MCI4407723.1 hypothetical protein [Thermofilum sp.]
MSVKTLEKELGEALYGYITGRLDALPSELKDKNRLASAMLYVQKIYHLTPQQIAEKIKERKQRSYVTSSLFRINGDMLRKLLGAMDYLRSITGRDTLQLLLDWHGIVVAGRNRDVVVTAEVPKTDGYYAPSSPMIVKVDTSRLIGENGGLNAEAFFENEGNVYAVKNGKAEVVGNKYINDYEKIDVNKLMREMYPSGNHIELRVKPEAIDIIRRLRVYSPNLYIVNEGKKPAMYLEFGNGTIFLRVPDQVITSADIDPYLFDKAYNSFPGSQFRNVLPEPSGEATLKTKIGISKSPLMLSMKGKNGVVYNFYYEPSDYQWEHYFEYYRYKPDITYQVTDDVFPSLFANMLEGSHDVYVIPMENKIAFANINTDSFSWHNIPPLLVLNTQSKYENEDAKELLNPESVFTMDLNEDTRRGNLLQQVYKIVKDVGASPQIGVNMNNISLWGLNYGLHTNLEERDAKHIREMAEWIASLDQNKASVIELTGADLLDMVSKHEASDDIYRDYLRLNVKPDGEAVIELVYKNGSEEKTLWRKVTKVSNPPEKEMKSSTPMDVLLRFEKLPFNTKSAKIRPDSLRKAKVEIFIAKEKPIVFLSDEYPVILKTQIGNTVMYTYLFTFKDPDEWATRGSYSF